MRWLNRDFVENFIRYHKKTIVKVIAGFVLFVIAFFVFCIRNFDEDGKEFQLIDGNDFPVENQQQVAKDKSKEIDLGIEAEMEQEKDTMKKSKIYIDVSGAVKRPYVYEMEAGARVYEAIDMAGGITEDADTSNLNLAQVLLDEDKITVFTKAQLVSEAEVNSIVNKSSVERTGGNGGVSVKGGADSEGLININDADATKLQTITGIGPSTAEKIITYRNEHGSFQKIEDIMRVSGIGEKTFAKFKDKITV